MTGRMMRELEALGLGPEDLTAYVAVLRGGRGLVVHCGPPGSGARTTAYAALRALARQDLAVLCIEDTSARSQQGVHQIPLDPAAGFDLDAAFLAVMRQDPDVIGVPRPPEPESAPYYYGASLAGAPLVLTTMPHSDPRDALRALTDMYPQLSETIQLVLGHRRTAGRGATTSFRLLRTGVDS